MNVSQMILQLKTNRGEYIYWFASFLLWLSLIHTFWKKEEA